MTASSATLSTWKRDAPASRFPQQDTCDRELSATGFPESETLEKWVEAGLSKLMIRSLTQPILNESRAALNRAIAHGHAQREDEKCA